MNLKNTVVHEMHEKTRTNPKHFCFTEWGDESNDCNPLSRFVPFVFFVDKSGVPG
jgi:hypothetical protein